jgi:hypothetical protein
MSTHLKFTTLGTAVDLTDTDVNKVAAATSTPRQGGFTLRNRIDFSKVTAANKLMWTCSDVTPATDTTNPFYVLEVPERTLVKDLRVFAVKSETVPSFSTYTVAAATDSDLDQVVLEFGAHRNKKPTDASSYAAATHLVALTTVSSEANTPDGALGSAPFGEMKMVMTSDAMVFVDPFQTVDSSLGNPLEAGGTHKAIRVTAATASGASTLSQWTDGEYFPYGGYVHIKLGPFNVNMSSDIATAADFHDGASDAATISLAGMWEVQANCNYVPE